MVLEVPGKWLWDSWYARDGELWHGYFLQADRALGDPELRHWNVTQGHAVSRDLKVLGAARHLLRAGAGARLGRLHHLDGLGAQGSRRHLAPLLHRHDPGRGRPEAAHRPRDEPRRAFLGPRRRRARARPLRRRLRGVGPRPLARPRHARPLGDAGPRGRGVADVLHRPGARGGRAERRWRHRLRHLARPRHLDAAAARLCRRRLRPAGGAAGVPGRRALVLPLLHRQASTGRRATPPLPASARSAAPTTSSATARAAPGGWRRGASSTATTPAGATRRASSTPAPASRSSASPTPPTASPSSAPSPIPSPVEIDRDGLLHVAPEGAAETQPGR